MIEKEESAFEKKAIQEAKQKYGKNIDSWKKNLEDAIGSSYNHIQKNPKKQSTKPESVKLLLKYGLILLEEKIYKEDFERGREIYYYMRDTLSKKESKIILSKEIDVYKQALALRGGVLVEKSHLKQDYKNGDYEMLKYYDKHIGNIETRLEKSITAVSLLSVISGVSIGYSIMTGNVISTAVSNNIMYGAILFLAGLLGIFFANKKKNKC